MTRGSRLGRQASALLAALALILAPLRAAFAVECGLCPADCPMHAAHAAAGDDHDRAPVMKCHGAAKHGDASPARTGAAQFRRPACDAHGALPGLALAPLVLPAAAPAVVLVARIARPPVVPLASTRSADPPDTPPPDCRA